MAPSKFSRSDDQRVTAAGERGCFDEIERPFSFGQFSDEQRHERVGRNAPFPADPIALFRCLVSSGAGSEHVVIHAMRHVEHAIVRRAELRQVLSRPSARREMPVEPAEHPAGLEAPQPATPADGRASEVGITTTERRHAEAPACHHRADQRHRVPAGHHDNVRARFCDGLANLRHVESPEVTAIDPIRRLGGTNYNGAITFAERRVP